MDNQNKKLLVVEDDNLLRDLYLDILKGAGYTVDSAADGEIAYQKILAGGYDLILLDIMLPKMDGLAIMKKVTTETPPALPNGPVVVLSNLGQDSAVAQAVEMGARGYMIKSDYTPDQVLKKVKEYLSP